VHDARLDLAVSDAGPGLREEVAPAVLDPFTSAGPGGGTGVGLALARGLAEAQGAQLRPPGAGGSRFVLSFPPAPVPQVA
jgi:signal transduction histidine kinase